MNDIPQPWIADFGAVAMLVFGAIHPAAFVLVYKVCKKWKLPLFLAIAVGQGLALGWIVLLGMYLISCSELVRPMLSNLPQKGVLIVVMSALLPYPCGFAVSYQLLKELIGIDWDRLFQDLSNSRRSHTKI